MTLTKKFLDYFDLKSPEEIEHKFKEYGSIQGLVAIFNRSLEPQDKEEQGEKEEEAEEE